MAIGGAYARWRRPVSWLIGLGLLSICLGILAGDFYFLVSIYSFEYEAILLLLGWSGILLWGFVSIESIFLLRRATKVVLGSGGFWPESWVARLRMLLFVVVLAWGIDWVLFTQRPMTFALTTAFSRTSSETRPASDAVYQSLPQQLRSDQRRFEQFQTILTRIVLNHPKDYSIEKVIASVNHYSEKYGIDPLLDYYWLYLTSFYGEAPAGRVPFLRSMTSETIRDFVQVHLPTWFVEADWRRSLIVSERFKEYSFLGHSGHDWQYAFQKATYDVSVEPYDTNVFTDVFLVMREYRSEFSDLFSRGASSSKVDVTLADSFVALDKYFMLPPYENSEYGGEAGWGPDLYQKYRDPMKKFARAVFYKMLLDIDFATKVQTLVARYYQEQFKSAFGEESWAQVSHEQQLSLLAMLRDVYTPNIGHASGNAYNLPEFNLAPFFYVREQALHEKNAILHGGNIWVPEDTSKLWSAAGTKLRVLSEVSEIFYGSALPGIRPTSTIEDAHSVITGSLRNTLE